MLVTGVGGTGVVTVGALITMAAHLEGKQASVLDFMGFAQKGGAVLSFVRVAPTADQLNQVRIDTQQADVLLACDMVVGASDDALATVKNGRTAILANTHEIATAAFVRNPDATMHAPALIDKLRHAAGDDRVQLVDAQALAQELMGDTMPSNIIMLGACWQRGLVPVSHAALMRAIELNNVAVDNNKTAFAIGRLAVTDPTAFKRIMGADQPPRGHVGGAVAVRARRPVERRVAFLTAYQDAALAARFRTLVEAGACARTGAGRGRRAADDDRRAAVLAAARDQGRVRGGAPVHRRQLREVAGRAVRLGGQDGIPHGPAAARAPGPQRPPEEDADRPVADAGAARARRSSRACAAPGPTRSATPRNASSNASWPTTTRPCCAPRSCRCSIADKHALAQQIARVPERIRGYGHVKLGNLATGRAQWRVLLDQWHGRGGDAATKAGRGRARARDPDQRGVSTRAATHPGPAIASFGARLLRAAGGVRTLGTSPRPVVHMHALSTSTRRALLALPLALACAGALAPAHAHATPVRVQLFGDSTQWGYDGKTRQPVAQPPVALLQARDGRALRRRRRARHRTGRAGHDLRRTARRHGRTQSPVAAGGRRRHRRRQPRAQRCAFARAARRLRRNLEALHPTVFETPNPVTVDWPSPAYVAAMRDVAAGQHAPVADVDAWMRRQPHWQALLDDGVHPTQAGYREIVQKVLMPTLEPLVVKAMQAAP